VSAEPQEAEIARLGAQGDGIVEHLAGVLRARCGGLAEILDEPAQRAIAGFLLELFQLRGQTALGLGAGGELIAPEFVTAGQAQDVSS